MKKLILSATVAALIGVASMSAMAANSGLVGVVNVQKIFMASPKVAAQKKTLMAKFATKKDQMQTAQAKLKTMLAKYKRNRTVMSKTQQQQAQTQLAGQQTKIMQMGQLFQQEAAQAQAKAMGGFIKQLQTAAASVAKKDHLSMIIPAHAVIYSSKTMDVTSDVAKAFNG
jgi:Skp family chaperone for outer membrane proteins